MIHVTDCNPKKSNASFTKKKDIELWKTISSPVPTRHKKCSTVQTFVSKLWAKIMTLIVWEIGTPPFPKWRSRPTFATKNTQKNCNTCPKSVRKNYYINDWASSWPESGILPKFWDFPDKSFFITISFMASSWKKVHIS